LLYLLDLFDVDIDKKANPANDKKEICMSLAPPHC